VLLLPGMLVAASKVGDEIAHITGHQILRLPVLTETYQILEISRKREVLVSTGAVLALEIAHSWRSNFCSGVKGFDFFIVEYS
jgi:hypothetical protein